MAMKWGKGYLGAGSGEESKPAESEPEEGGEDHESAIHQHLQQMHQMTGHGHSHIEHKPEGHVAHHVDHEGQVSGPEPHEDCPGGMCGGGM